MHCGERGGEREGWRERKRGRESKRRHEIGKKKSKGVGGEGGMDEEGGKRKKNRIEVVGMKGKARKEEKEEEMWKEI